MDGFACTTQRKGWASLGRVGWYLYAEYLAVIMVMPTWACQQTKINSGLALKLLNAMFSGGWGSLALGQVCLLFLGI